MDDISQLQDKIKKHIGKDVAELMFTINIFESYLRPIFGAHRFPITYQSMHLSEIQIERFMREMFRTTSNGTLAYEVLTRQNCIQYHQWLINNGLLSGKLTPSLAVDGLCTKQKKCKVTPDKFSCSNCGKAYVPGSNRSKTCKRWPDPFWAKHLQRKINSTLAKQHHSETGPIVWDITNDSDRNPFSNEMEAVK